MSPAWPVGYDDLEPYYTQAERLYHVHGQRGEDPTEPSAREPNPHPAISHEPRIQHLADDFGRLGLKPFHTPLGVMLNERAPHLSKCIRCETCDGFPCLVACVVWAPGCPAGPPRRSASPIAGRDLKRNLIFTVVAAGEDPRRHRASLCNRFWLRLYFGDNLSPEKDVIDSPHFRQPTRWHHARNFSWRRRPPPFALFAMADAANILLPPVFSANVRLR